MRTRLARNRFPIPHLLLLASAVVAGCRVLGRSDSTEASANCRRSDLVGAPAVGWVGAAPPQQQDALAGWCATVGPPVLLPGPAAPPVPADSLVVVSWNVHVGGGSIPELVAELRSGRLTDGVPPAHFVLLLQEAYRGGAAVPSADAATAADIPHRIAPLPPGGVREDVVEVARRLGLWLVYVPSMRNGPGVAEPREDRGNAILSTLPLADPTAIELPLETQRRVPVTAWVSGRTAGGASWGLRLVSAHLDHRGPWSRPLSSFGGARLAQAKALAWALTGTAAGSAPGFTPAGPTRALTGTSAGYAAFTGASAGSAWGAPGPAGEMAWDPSASARTAPIVIGSDLNTWSVAGLEAAVPYLRSRFPSGPPEPRGATFTVAGIGRRLDHAFFRLPEVWTAHTRIVPNRFGSDHNPLISVVRFVPATPPRGWQGPLTIRHSANPHAGR